MESHISISCIKKLEEILPKEIFDKMIFISYDVQFVKYMCDHPESIVIVHYPDDKVRLIPKMVTSNIILSTLVGGKFSSNCYDAYLVIAEKSEDGSEIWLDYLYKP